MSHQLPDPNRDKYPAWSLSDRLRKAREEAGLEQGELAELAGLSRATISAAENGHRRPAKATIAMWALATGVSRDWLSGVTGTNLDPATALDMMRLTALTAVITASGRPEAAGYEEAEAVLSAVAEREKLVQRSGRWVASSKIDHPEVEAWCLKYRPSTADALAAARKASASQVQP
ncbi:helix-turn-helix domain-containing protein [Agromyces mariniharenae]|uniref:Helix-turn-helix transcriptional regulator n=1 Tax=Agromyces mariniharenae TaxID=2604423 RepID=A0A5S4V783_9MICO|nr:helix-turn-helix domain-containing protein [Agromyces mariniharenae]TYL53161.1 helix-turn-helix transcriptional regulator [Agromyces mariniharenae]